MAKEKKKPIHGGRTRPRRTKRLLRWGSVVVVVAVIGWFTYRAGANLPGTPIASLGNDHIPAIGIPHFPYNSDPPTSGPHVGYLAQWGIHAGAIPKELQVHNLEDGGVLVQYICPEGCSDLVEKLQAIVSRYNRQVILAPYPGMDRRIALTAWGRIDKFGEFDEQRILRFIKAYRGVDHHPPASATY